MSDKDKEIFIKWEKLNDDRNRQDALRTHDKSHELRKTLLEAATKDAHIAITVILGINGGAAVALLAFVGNVAEKGKPVAGVIPSLQWFVYGVISAALAAIGAYLSNNFYANVHRSRDHDFVHP